MGRSEMPVMGGGHRQSPTSIVDHEFRSRISRVELNSTEVDVVCAKYHTISVVGTTETHPGFIVRFAHDNQY